MLSSIDIFGNLGLTDGAAFSDLANSLDRSEVDGVGSEPPGEEAVANRSASIEDCRCDSSNLTK